MNNKVINTEQMIKVSIAAADDDYGEKRIFVLSLLSKYVSVMRVYLNYKAIFGSLQYKLFILAPL